MITKKLLAKYQEYETLVMKKINKRVLESSAREDIRYKCHIFTESSLARMQCMQGIRKKIYHCLYSIGDNTGLSYNLHIHKPHRMNSGDLIIGNNVWIGYGVHIDYSGGVIIDDNASISEGTTLYSHNHSILKRKKWVYRRSAYQIEYFPLHIGDSAWIGSNCTILPNTTYIGKRACISAGSVVTRDVPDGAIVAGNPATIIGYRDA